MSTPKVLTLSLLLLSGLAAAQNTLPAPSTPKASTTTIIDVPATHWARDAVTLLVSRGVIKGFPDSTFRGNQPLTRYQAAVMFAGVLGTTQFNQVVPTLTPDQKTVLVNGLQDLAAQIATIATRQTDNINATDDINTRLKKIETVVEQIVAIGATRTDVEAAMTTLRSELASKVEVADLASKVEVADLASKAEVAGLQNRLVTLEADRATRDTQAAEQAAKAEAASQAEAAAKAAATPSLPAPAALPNVTFKPDAPSRYDVGVGISKPLSSTGLGLSVNFLAKNVIGQYGALVTGSYGKSDQNLSVQANITRAFKGGMVTPYVGAGIGILGSPSRAAPSTASQPAPSDTNTSSGDSPALPTSPAATPAANGNSYDVFGSAMGGVDYAFTDVISLFAETDSHYFLSRNGSGTSSTPLGLSMRAGVRIHF